jgi:hypothetical protein
MKGSKRRLALLRELEAIVGNECFNPNIQNRQRGGVLASTGREFRYPITFSGEGGAAIKRRSMYDDLPPHVQMTGYYACGANELRIMNALDKLVSYLEETRGLKV